MPRRQRAQDTLPIREKVVQRARARTRALADRLHRHALQATLDYQGGGGVQHAVDAPLTAILLRLPGGHLGRGAHGGELAGHASVGSFHGAKTREASLLLTSREESLLFVETRDNCLVLSFLFEYGSRVDNAQFRS
jgi:hypothetical protein